MVAGNFPFISLCTHFLSDRFFVHFDRKRIIDFQLNARSGKVLLIGILKAQF